MRLRHGDSEEADPTAAADAAETVETADSVEDDGGARAEERRPRGAQTEKKGRPTPKRSDSQRRRGPVGPAPMTAKEARERRKRNKDGTKKSKAERKAEAAERRSQMSDRREKMMAGDEAYLMPRDRGPVRRYVRDRVDSRRHLLGLFMPLALVMIVTMFMAPFIQAIVSLAMLVMVAVMAVEGFVLGRKINREVRERFDDVRDSRFSLGFYAFVRASQLRKMRTPRPQVAVGDEI